MSQQSGGGSGRNAAFVAAVLAAVVAIAGVFFVTRVMNGGEDEAATTGAVPADRSQCTQLRVASSPEKATVLGEIAAAYNEENRTVEGACTYVEVTRASSGAAAAALARGWDEERDGARPDVWSPSASSWGEIASQSAVDADQPDIFPADPTSIANSPLVIAMPRPMAEALGWPDKELGWGDMLAISRAPDGWGSVGHPEWGSFRLGKTNPNLSTSGLNATIATYFAATGVASDLTTAQVQDPATAAYVREVEQSVVHYGDTTLTFLNNLLKADQAGAGLTYISAVAVEEKSVVDYNEGNPEALPEKPADAQQPDTPLVSIYPKEGTLLSDSPWIVLDAEWVDTAKKAVAADLLAYVLEGEQQDRLAEAGFRRADGSVGPKATEEAGILADQPTAVLGVPPAPVLKAIVDSWDLNRKPANVLMVLDVSGSMSALVSGTGDTRLDVAKRATIEALDEFAPQDEVGLWIFSSESAQGSRPYRELVPVGPAPDTLPKVQTAVAALAPGGGTGLYATTKASVQALREDLNSSRINGVVLLSDGQNEHPDSDLDAVLDLLDVEDAALTVRVFTIGYGEDADQGNLERIAEASRAKSYDASDPSTIDKVMVDVLSNF